MIWFVRRERARLHYEIRQGSDEPGYELIVTYPDGSQRVERYPEARRAVERSCRLRSELIGEGWRDIGGA